MSELFNYMLEIDNHDTTVSALIQTIELRIDIELDDDQRELIDSYYIKAIQDDAEILTKMLDEGEVTVEELKKFSVYISGLIFQRTMVELLYIFATGGDKP